VSLHQETGLLTSQHTLVVVRKWSTRPSLAIV